MIYGKKIYAVYDKSALQWNRFVKDFCADDAAKDHNSWSCFFYCHF